MKKNLPHVVNSDPDIYPWTAVQLPDGETIGYSEAQVLYKIWKFSPTSTELREAFDLTYDPQLLSNLIRKQMAYRSQRTFGRGRPLVASKYGRRTIKYLQKNHLLDMAGPARYDSTQSVRISDV